jgi:hypothetical protein
MMRSQTRSQARSDVRGARAALGLVTLAVAALAGPAAAVQVTRGPYLQMPTPSSVVVRWRTDVATDSRVQYGAAPGALTEPPVDDPTVTTEHEILVAGLDPGTQYHYSVGSSAGPLAGDDADHVFRTPPPVGTRVPTRVWVTGDGGFANANGQAVRDAYAAFAAGSETHLWLLLGDNAYLAGTDAEYQAALFDMHRDLLRRVPAWPTFGNHEAASSNSLAETGPYFQMFSLPRLGEAGGVPSGTEAYYAFDHANVHFIVLDSHFSSNAAGSPMMVWLEADLQATTADWVVAYWHHPPYSKGLFHDSDLEGREINMRRNVLPLLEDHGVDLVLCGHSHSYERSRLLDGHYGFSSELLPAMVLDSGDGRPGGDGAYRKATTGPAPHEGAVYVVAGSSSEVRAATLNHPVMEIGLLELGSLVLDVDGDTLTGTFVNSLVQTTDTFTIVKRPACPAAPRPGCGTAPTGRLVVKDNADDALDTLAWRWRRGVLDPATVGAPDDQTDLALCVWDATGGLVDAALPRGADAPVGTEWKPARQGGFVYRSPTASVAGVRRLRVRVGARTALAAKGVGVGLDLPALPLAPPVTVQLANLDNGACWESVFTTPRKNDATRFLATGP